MDLFEYLNKKLKDFVEIISEIDLSEEEWDRALDNLVKKKE